MKYRAEFRAEWEKYIEKMVRDGATTWEAWRAANANGFPYCLSRVYNHIRKVGLNKLADQNQRRRRLEGIRFATPYNQTYARPKFIWNRYYFVRAKDGFAIIDRMGQNFSTPYMWVEEISATFGKYITVVKVEEIVKKLNSTWHEEIRREKCQTTTE